MDLDVAAECAHEDNRIADVSPADYLIDIFQDHVADLKRRRVERKEALRLRGITATEATPLSAVVHSAVDAGDEMMTLDTDEFEGDGALRTLIALLSRIDSRGYARSRQQLTFHDAFIRACSRVIYKSDWAASRPTIMKNNGWKKCPSEILISTPR